MHIRNHLADPAPRQQQIISVADPGLYSRVLEFRARVYRQHYPAITHPDAPDIYDFGSHYFTTVNGAGEVTSCSRLVLDSEKGLPSEPYLTQHLESYRRSGQRLAELGRMAVDDDTPGVVIAHFAHALQVARQCSVAFIVFVAPWQKRAFYIKYLGAQLICADIQESYGSGKTFSIYVWPTATPAYRLQRRISGQPVDLLN